MPQNYIAQIRNKKDTRINLHRTKTAGHNYHENRKINIVSQKGFSMYGKFDIKIYS